LAVALATIIPGTVFAQQKTYQPQPFHTDCALLGHALCEGIHDKPVIILAGVHTGLLITDGIYTRQSVKRGGTELDPISRAFLGRRPEWNRMIPIGAALIIAEVIVTEKMRHSEHRTIRKLAFVPLLFGIAASAQGSAYSATH
jgi:hypothetical protein